MIARLGEWPGPAGGDRRAGLAEGHARAVWESAAVELRRRARGVNRALPRGAEFGGGVDLLFLQRIGAHLASCRTCWVVWRDGEQPVDWLTWAVRKRRAGEVFKAVLDDQLVEAGLNPSPRVPRVPRTAG